MFIPVLAVQFLVWVATAESALPTASQIEVMVEDKSGNPISGLVASDFEIRSGRTVCHLLSASQSDEPLTIGIMVDTSASMRDRLGRGLRDEIAKFLDESHPNNTYFVVEFADDVNLVVDYTQDHRKVLEVLPRRFRGRTLLFQALEACNQKIKKREGRKALLVVSDGSDSSGRSVDSVLEALDIPVLGLCPLVPLEYFEHGPELARIC